MRGQAGGQIHNPPRNETSRSPWGPRGMSIRGFSGPTSTGSSGDTSRNIPHSKVIKSHCPLQASRFSRGGEKFHDWHYMYLLMRWSLGLISSPTLQAHALADYDGQVRLLSSLGLSCDSANKSLRALAALGKWGRCPNHINEALLNCLG